MANRMINGMLHPITSKLDRALGNLMQTCPDTEEVEPTATSEIVLDLTVMQMPTSRTYRPPPRPPRSGGVECGLVPNGVPFLDLDYEDLH